MAYKRILTIQDISCVGQCSMTVALPILSACGHETCILPTAVLSTHTGGFQNPVITSLADTMWQTAEHWKREGITFDAIYVGYLGSIRAIEITEKILGTMLAPGGLAIVDPAMGDNGRLYSGFDDAYAEAMKGLCQKADIILPNITEAAMFAGLPFRAELTEEYVAQLLDRLTEPCVLLTGVGYSPEETGILIRQGGHREHLRHPKIPRSFHGTGDIFASCFVGSLMQGKAIREAVEIAAEAVQISIRNTMDSPAHWYGVKFETALPALIRRLEN